MLHNASEKISKIKEGKKTVLNSHEWEQSAAIAAIKAMSSVKSKQRAHTHRELEESALQRVTNLLPLARRALSL